ncbi:MAG: sugar transferase [Faecalicoccus sp.]|nr:sugar transferase [Faecalicoccus sp.]
MKKWEDLPEELQLPEIKEYYDILKNKKVSRFVKRLFDIVVSLILLVVLCHVMIIIAILIQRYSEGGVLFRQERVTTYGKIFKIHKFRTMVKDADKIGSQVTTGSDARITGIGSVLRKYRLDELPQLIDVLTGDMSFVGCRPEVVKYVNAYTNEMKATLLMPAGITSEASIRYKDEAELLDGADDVDKVYIEQILPAKMKYNLDSIRNFNIWNEFATMIRTVLAVLGKEYH